MPAKVALVLGANGISGHAMLEELVKTPNSDWSSIIAVSRRPQQITMQKPDPRLKFIAIDILAKSVAEISQALNEAGGENITHVFHYTYIPKRDEQELVEINVALLERALNAIVNVAKKLQVFMLQTGLKYYASHKAVAESPMMEEAPRVFLNEPNFYYNQVDLVMEYAQKYGFKWIDTRPACIIGVAKGNAMNAVTCLALYAAVQKELGLPLSFPGNSFNWTTITNHSSADVIARFQLFLVNHPDAGNQSYNIVNGDFLKWKQAWPKFAKYFGLEFPDPVFKKPMPEYFAVGSRNPLVCEQSVMEYMRDKKPVWEKIAAKYGVDAQIFDGAQFGFLDALTGSPNMGALASMDRGRKLGWTEYEDSAESYFKYFDQLKALKMIPNY